MTKQLIDFADHYRNDIGIAFIVLRTHNAEPAAATTTMASVIVAPAAFCAISLHATRHKHSTVHGVLVGTCLNSTVRVEQAIPICHGTPTLPLIETALGLLAEKNIVGWYTAPLLLEDTSPSLVAQKMVAGLESNCNSEPILVVVQNQGLAACLGESGAPAGGALTVFGKNNAKKWARVLSLTVEDSNKATKAALEAMQQSYVLDDFEDHLDGPASAIFPDKELVKLVSKIRG